MIARGILSHLLLLTMLQVLPATGFGSNTHECVIVLHGLGRTAYSMSRIENALENNHYLVWNESYPSTSENIEELATTAINKGLKFCSSNNAATIHFVTHSLGGILVRQYLQHNTIAGLGRIVMLSPPNQGSEVADLRQLKPVKGEIGIITGDNSLDPWFSPVIPGEDDGKVSVESAKLDEMSDFITVHNGHTFIMRDQRVINQILYFLGHGRFSKEASTAVDD
jgi:hypothetical protein